ncbi:MAG: hypothetical protein AAF213_03120 [Pseudomonadota bacterium]
MAFNIIGRSGSVPAIFGDAKDMALMTNVLVDRATGAVTLELANANPRKRKQQIPVSKELAAVMREADHVVAVAVDRFGDTEKAELISLQPMSYGKRTSLPMATVVETVSGLLAGQLTIDTVVHRASIGWFHH